MTHIGFLIFLLFDISRSGQPVPVTGQFPTIVEEHADGFKTGFAVVVALGGLLMVDHSYRRQLLAMST